MRRPQQPYRRCVTWGTRLKQRGGSKCSGEAGNAGKVDYGRERSLASCRLGIYQNGLRGLFSDRLRSSRELEASVTLTPSPGASPRIVFIPWGCLGTAGAAARSTDLSKPCWESSLDSRSSSPISLSFLALPFLLLLLFFPRCSEEGESST